MARIKPKPMVHRPAVTPNMVQDVTTPTGGIPSSTPPSSSVSSSTPNTSKNGYVVGSPRGVTTSSVSQSQGQPYFVMMPQQPASVNPNQSVQQPQAQQQQQPQIPQQQTPHVSVNQQQQQSAGLTPNSVAQQVANSLNQGNYYNAVTATQANPQQYPNAGPQAIFYVNVSRTSESMIS